MEQCLAQWIEMDRILDLHLKNKTFINLGQELLPSARQEQKAHADSIWAALGEDFSLWKQSGDQRPAPKLPRKLGDTAVQMTLIIQETFHLSSVVLMTSLLLRHTPLLLCFLAWPFSFGIEASFACFQKHRGGGFFIWELVEKDEKVISTRFVVAPFRRLTGLSFTPCLLLSRALVDRPLCSPLFETRVAEPWPEGPLLLMDSQGRKEGRKEGRTEKPFNLSCFVRTIALPA